MLLVHALITSRESRLDYANALFYGLPAKFLRKLLRVQNVAARIVTGTRRTAHITPVLKSLHWLPLHQRIAFKLCLLVHKCIHGSAPAYLAELLTLRTNNCDLRSNGTFLLDVPRVTSAMSQRAFGVAGPQVWNTLPMDLRNKPDTTIFKRKLKTLLFIQAFN